jgi:recombinational DNA repair ATPase RecF
VDALVGRLREAREADVQRGFTSVSGSRDDFRLLQGGRRWVGSRGESKVVGVLLQLAGQAVVEESGGPSAVWLVDDLAAELSDESCHRLFAAIQQRAPQVLLTALPGKAPRSFASMFHVEQGAVELIRPHLRAIAQ